MKRSFWRFIVACLVAFGSANVSAGYVRIDEGLLDYESGDWWRLGETTDGFYFFGNQPSNDHIPFGTYSSYLLSYDQPGGGRYLGAESFDYDIVAVIFNSNKLRYTDGLLRSPYTPPGASDGPRGSEFDSTSQDMMSFFGKTIHFDMRVYGQHFDQLRVLTAVPLPPAAILFVSALVGFVAISRRKKGEAARSF